MTKNEALRMGMDALVSVLANHKGAPVVPWNDALDGMKAALEAKDDHALIDAGLLNSDIGMLRTRGTRTWVGLTEAQCGVLWKVNMTPFDYYQAIEAKLKEKNT
jgi:hypothetical protein